MGLFSNKNKLCPLCGKATPLLFSTKIEGQPLCSDCADAIAADDALRKGWTLDEARQHLAYRAENKAMVDSFPVTRTVDFGRELVIDDNGKRFFVRQWTHENPPIFRFDEIQGFTMKRGWHTVENWSRGAVRTPYQPPELGTLGALASLAGALTGNKDDDEQNSDDLSVTLLLNNSYLTEYELISTSICGNGEYEFNRSLAEELAHAHAVCDAIVGMSAAAGAPVGAAPADEAGEAANEIMKYKRLLDAGAITQAEFEAKKKQLLGL